MKEFYIKVTYPLLLTSILFSCCSSVSKKQSQKIRGVENIQFIPKEFHDIELGYYETEENLCSPKFTDGIIPLNTISINTPQKIIVNSSNENFTPSIPVCVAYMVSLRRGLKYNHLSTRILYVKQLSESITYLGEFIDKDMQYEHPILPPGYEDAEKKRLAMVEEAQKYSDMELNQGQSGGGYMNINLMEYVDMPFLPGKYEVWISFCGLESNHAIVEIIAE